MHCVSRTNARRPQPPQVRLGLRHLELQQMSLAAREVGGGNVTPCTPDPHTSSLSPAPTEGKQGQLAVSIPQPQPGIRSSPEKGRRTRTQPPGAQGLSLGPDPSFPVPWGLFLLYIWENLPYTPLSSLSQPPLPWGK